MDMTPELLLELIERSAPDINFVTGEPFLGHRTLIMRDLESREWFLSDFDERVIDHALEAAYDYLDEGGEEGSVWIKVHYEYNETMDCKVWGVTMGFIA